MLNKSSSFCDLNFIDVYYEAISNKLYIAMCTINVFLLCVVHSPSSGNSSPTCHISPLNVKVRATYQVLGLASDDVVHMLYASTFINYCNIKADSYISDI